MVVTQALVGQRYGGGRLPSTVPAVDLDRIRTALIARRTRDLKHAAALLDQCYQLDENAVEPNKVYRLTNRNSVSSPHALADLTDVCTSDKGRIHYFGKRGRIKGSESSRQRDPVLKAPVWVGDEPLKTHI